jgi:hypothetical protein
LTEDFCHPELAVPAGRQVSGSHQLTLDIENNQFFSPQNQLFQKFYLGYDRWGDRRGEYEEKILV